MKSCNALQVQGKHRRTEHSMKYMVVLCISSGCGVWITDIMEVGHYLQVVVVLRVSLHCRGCEKKMRKHLSRMEGGYNAFIYVYTFKNL